MPGATVTGGALEVRAQLFTPAALPGLVAWFDASDESTLVVDGSGYVSQWDNKSGGPPATQGIAARQPQSGTRTINGLNALDFWWGATQSALKMTLATGVPSWYDLGTNDSTVFAVVNMDAQPISDNRIFGWNQAYQVDDAHGGSMSAVRRDGTTNDWGIYYSNSMRAKVTCSATGVHLLTTMRDGDSAYAWLNGGSAATTTGLGTANFSQLECAVIGGMSPTETSGGWNLDGAVAEIVWCSGALSTADREAARDFLNAKWQVF
jgi:hypothetical protein